MKAIIFIQLFEEAIDQIYKYCDQIYNNSQNLELLHKYKDINFVKNCFIKTTNISINILDLDFINPIIRDNIKKNILDTNFILLKLNIFHFIKINNLENTYFDKTCFLVDEYGWSIINYANLDSNELDNYNFDNNIQGWYVSQILRNIKTKNKINFDSCIFSKISGLENCDLSNIIFIFLTTFFFNVCVTFYIDIWG